MTAYYLIWSHQHGAWWCPGGFGYTQHVGDAGRFGRDKALEICRAALPGQYKPGGPFPDLPIAEDDLKELIAADVGGYHEPPAKTWHLRTTAARELVVKASSEVDALAAVKSLLEPGETVNETWVNLDELEI